MRGKWSRRIFFVGLVLLLAGCTSRKEVGEALPFVTATWYPAGPDDYRNMFDRNIDVYQDGRMTFYTQDSEGRLKNKKNAPIKEVQRSEQEVTLIKDNIEKTQAYKLKKDLSTDSMDGTYVYLTFHWVDESEKVGGLNPDNEVFNQLMDQIKKTAGKDAFKEWEKEATDFMFKENP